VQTHLPPEALPASQLAQNPAGQVERSNQDQASSSSSDQSAAAIIRATGTGAAAISNAAQAAARGGSTGGGSPGGSGSGQQQAPLAQAIADSQAVSGAAVSQGLGLSQTSPSQQIFQAIQSEMPASAASQIAAQASLPGTYQPVKNLTIALDPPGLGSVAVELSYKGGELGVKVEASQADTAQLLQRDGGALAQLLQTAGFTVANVSVHTAASPATPDAAAQQSGGGQQFSGAFTSSGGGGGAQPGAGQNQSQPHSQGEPSGLGGSQKESGYGRSETNAGGQSLYV
jgi:flagellar hook-length control protein FliK